MPTGLDEMGGWGRGRDGRRETAAREGRDRHTEKRGGGGGGRRTDRQRNRETETWRDRDIERQTEMGKRFLFLFYFFITRGDMEVYPRAQFDGQNTEYKSHYDSR